MIKTRSDKPEFLPHHHLTVQKYQPAVHPQATGTNELIVTFEVPPDFRTLLTKIQLWQWVVGMFGVVIFFVLIDKMRASGRRREIHLLKEPGFHSNSTEETVSHGMKAKDKLILACDGNRLMAEADIKKAIKPASPLLETRILTIKRSEIGRGIQLNLPSGLLEVLFATAKNTQDLMGAFLESSPAATLMADDFGHVHAETDLLNAYLSGLQGNETRGVNILIYGPPGTHVRVQRVVR